MSNENNEVSAAREALNAARINELSRILPIYRTREQQAELDRLTRISPTSEPKAYSRENAERLETPEPVAASKPSSTRPPKRRKSRAWIGVTAAAVLGLGIGAGVGASQVPEPETRVETKIETVTETETVEVETTPAECIAALKSSDEIVELHATYVGHVGNILDAASVQNLIGVESAGDFMAATNDDMLDVIREYVADRDACRGAAS